MPRASKGSDFERELCKKLSRWWTHGERDDVFWRSSQSGGRATQRAKFGKATFGSYGDIAAVDPIGQPLLTFFTIELKRGSSYGQPGDLLDSKKDCKHPFLACLRQAIHSHKQARSFFWLLICRRDHRLPVVFVPSDAARVLHVCAQVDLRRLPHMRFYNMEEPFFGLQLDIFLSNVTPEQIMKCVKQL